MTLEELAECFEECADAYLESSVVPQDLAAFNKLYAMGVVEFDIVSSACHDEIWLGADVDKLAGLATKEDILELVRLGVMYDRETCSLHMFV